MPAATILNHMVDDQLDTTFTALADPTRRGMLAALTLGEKPVSQLAAPNQTRPHHASGRRGSLRGSSGANGFNRRDRPVSRTRRIGPFPTFLLISLIQLVEAEMVGACLECHASGSLL